MNRKNVLIAVGRKEYSKILRTHISNHPDHFHVAEQEVLHQRYLHEVVDLEKPDILIVHDYYLESEATDKKEREEEWLTFLKRIRVEYDDSIRVVFLCERPKGDPFLSYLVNINVLDIFNTRSIDLVEMIDQLKDKPRFSRVSKFVIKNQKINYDSPEEDEIETSDDSLDEIEDIIEEVENQTEKKEKKVKKEKKEKKSKPDRESEDKILTAITQIDEEELFIDVPVKETVVVKERLVGAVFVGVVGVESNTGSTHTSLLLANFLNNRGLRVAVIEANQTEHLFQIEYAYEGGRGYVSIQDKFSIKGIDHYKSIKELNIPELIHQYDFIILDIGEMGKTDYFDEFFRSHIKIVTAHGSEWKRNELITFLNSLKQHEQENWTLAIPFVDQVTLSDIEKDTELKAFSIPTQSDPYEQSNEITNVFEEMLTSYLPSKKVENKPISLLVGGGISAVVVSLLVIVAITFFK
ncbi:hypothetical protein [Bacillus sp. AFS040349]|uniref:hypothetical protein n=1 Tax=Bacillus sp. AFS040349 TaxID=2033502 RepID=UPI000BFC5945|nr:hypothetical protein [Bacillus sp. AFS040349]PGT82222.1 hypothetical protein COD11_15615 [Bacillus sp. AFS040349]